MKALTLIHPYYQNPEMFRRQQETWAAYPDDLKSRIHIIVVDDGSPSEPAMAHLIPTGVASFALYRCLVDVRWNWLFCRNLAMSQTTTEWALMTDIDHVLPAETLRALLIAKLDLTIAYNLNRVDAPLMKVNPKPHPNTWLMTKALFDRVGGYDERFSGYYGTDGEFRRRVKRVAQTVMLPQALIRYTHDVIPDADTRRYGRKEPQDAAVQRIFMERENSNDRAPKRLTFPWLRVH